MSSLQELVESASKKYQQIFGSKPIFGGHGSGRVNLIGEHTDYNDGLVLPMALPLHTVVVGGVSKDGNCCIETMAPVDGTARACFSFDGLPPKSNAEELWSLYMKGVIANFPGREELKPFNAVVASTVPLGSGLSSSAALEVATFYFLDSILGGKTTTGLDPADKAKVCQKSEHDWVGVPCGLMDQLVSVAGKQNRALLIDCRTNSIEYVPLPSDEYVFAVTNSNVKHEHSNNEYANRKRSCEQVASLLGKSSLRDISMRELESSQNVLSQDLYRIARHVITENERTFNAADALKRNDLTVFGTLMTQSHISLRDDYQVSCPELDELVDIALKTEGVLGSRMTGGGFGGSTVTLVLRTKAQTLKEKIVSKYSKGNATVQVFSGSEGGGRISFQ